MPLKADNWHGQGAKISVRYLMESEVWVHALRDRYELMVPGETTSLAMIRWVVSRLATAAGLEETDVGRIEFAVDEACSNVLDHAYKSRNPRPPIHLCIQPSSQSFTVDVIDEGATFDVAGYVEPKFPDHWLEGNARGAGWYLIRRCMDEVHYEQLPNTRNRLRMVKHRPKVAPAEV